MELMFDGKKITFDSDVKNVVELCDKNGIDILAKCYRGEGTGGCCGTCIIEVGDKRGYACATKPQDGMNITYNRDDLINDRQERLIAYEKRV